MLYCTVITVYCGNHVKLKNGGVSKMKGELCRPVSIYEDNIKMNLT